MIIILTWLGESYSSLCGYFPLDKLLATFAANSHDPLHPTVPYSTAVLDRQDCTSI